MGYESKHKGKFVQSRDGRSTNKVAPGITLPHERMTPEQRAVYADFIPVKRVVIAR